MADGNFTQLRSIRFLSTNISQGSVATYLRCSGMFTLLQIPGKSFSEKIFENPSAFGKVRDKNVEAPFPQTPGRTVGLKSDRTMGQLEVDTPWVTVPSCLRATARWDSAGSVFKQWDDGTDNKTLLIDRCYLHHHHLVYFMQLSRYRKEDSLHKLHKLNKFTNTHRRKQYYSKQ